MIRLQAKSAAPAANFKIRRLIHHRRWNRSLLITNSATASSSNDILPTSIFNGIASFALAAAICFGGMRAEHKDTHTFPPYHHIGVHTNQSSLFRNPGPAHARLEGVNRPELLPEGPVTPVIDVAGFLTDGEEARIKQRVEALEKDTGIRLRVLAQNYPETPGLAIKDYWNVDTNTVVFVYALNLSTHYFLTFGIVTLLVISITSCRADPNTGNILNFNVGDNVDLMVPRVCMNRSVIIYM